MFSLQAVLGADFSADLISTPGVRVFIWKPENGFEKVESGFPGHVKAQLQDSKEHFLLLSVHVLRPAPPLTASVQAPC